MLDIIETPFGFLRMYDFCINAGIFVSVIVQCILLYKKLRQWKYLSFSISYLIILYFGQYASAFVRCINDGALDGKMNLWRGVTEQVGTHFLGHVIAYSVLLLPLMWIVMSLFAEPDGKILKQGANILFLCLPVQHIFNRLGCLCQGCCYGMSYDGILALSLPCNEDIPYPTTFPAQLLEIAGMILLLMAAGVLYRKGKDIIGIIMLGFAIPFFVSEFFMCNPYAVKHFGLTCVQYLCILEAVLGSLYYLLLQKKVFPFADAKTE